jgi:uncharacterized hydrophobic protein (TIGR00271 family)
MSVKFFATLPKKQKKTIYETIKENAAGNASYVFVVILGAVVATLGLLTSNIAVIIGAMLISPIMNPLISLSFSIATGDSDLFGKSFKTLLLGVFLALGVSFLATFLVPERSLTSEILSRTQPTLIDLIIAVASGSAGAYTMFRKTGLMILPGVAIATAIMPPLCVVGVGLAFGNAGVAIGGALLFLANLIAINLAAAVIFKLMGFSIDTAQAPVDPDNKKAEAVFARQHKRRFTVSVVAFVIISIPLSLFMYHIITTTQAQNTIETSLETALSTYSNVEFVDYSYEHTDGQYDINITVNAERKPTRDEIIKIQNSLAGELDAPVEVTMRVVFSTEVSAEDVSEP